MREVAVEAAQRFLAALNSHDAESAVAVLAENVVFWEPTYPEPRVGRESVRRDLEGFFAMLPDIRFSAENLLVEGDLVFCEVSYSASYEGRKVGLRECSLSRLNADGAFSEVRVYFDRLTLLRQLGLVPADEPWQKGD